MERILEEEDPARRVEFQRHTDTLMIWQSMLRGVGIYSGCTRCYDVCPVGADYERHLEDVQQAIAETTPEKEQRLREYRSGRGPSADLDAHRRWIGVPSQPVMTSQE